MKFYLLVVEETEVLEATKEGLEIPTPDDLPVHLDLTATVDKVNLNHSNVLLLLHVVTNIICVGFVQVLEILDSPGILLSTGIF